MNWGGGGGGKIKQKTKQEGLYFQDEEEHNVNNSFSVFFFGGGGKGATGGPKLLSVAYHCHIFFSITDICANVCLVFEELHSTCTLIDFDN